MIDIHSTSNAPGGIASPNLQLPYDVVEIHDFAHARRWMGHFEKEYQHGSGNLELRYLVCDIARVLVCRVDGQEAGFIRLVDKTAQHKFPLTTLGAIWRVSEACVLPKWRDRGVYTALLQYAVTHANAHMVFLDPEVAMEQAGFYQRRGFPHLVHHLQTGMCSAVTPQYWDLRARRFAS